MLMDGKDLSEEEAEYTLGLLLTEANEVLISAFLVLLSSKGESFEEVSIDIISQLLYLLICTFHHLVILLALPVSASVCTDCRIGKGNDQCV